LQRQIANSDVWRDFDWGRPSRALAEPWVSSWLLRGAPEGLLAAQVGDLVFVLRSDYLPGVDHPWLARRAVVGLWWVESISEWTEQTPSGPLDCAEAACFPVRRFDFPVPVIQTGQMDKHFYKIKTLRDRSRRAMMRLTDQEALAMARNCGLPAAVLTEPDPDRLAPLCAGLDLGPPDMVRRRIQQGAKAVAHRDAVEASARDVAVAALRREGFGVVSTENRRGVGSDLWAAGCEADGTETHVRVEVKGLSGNDPWAAVLTTSERNAAVADHGVGGWWLLIVTNAARSDRAPLWVSGTEVAAVYSKPAGPGRWVADRAAARQLLTP